MKLSSRDSVDAIQNGNDIHHEDSELNPKLNDNMHGINYIPQCLPLFNFGRHDHNIFPTNPVNKIKKKQFLLIIITTLNPNLWLIKIQGKRNCDQHNHNRTVTQPFSCAFSHAFGTTIDRFLSRIFFEYFCRPWKQQNGAKDVPKYWNVNWFENWIQL